jgi:hypothetical protein
VTSIAFVRNWRAAVQRATLIVITANMRPAKIFAATKFLFQQSTSRTNADEIRVSAASCFSTFS